MRPPACPGHARYCRYTVADSLRVCWPLCLLSAPAPASRFFQASASPLPALGSLCRLLPSAGLDALPAIRAHCDGDACVALCLPLGLELSSVIVKTMTVCSSWELQQGAQCLDQSGRLTVFLD